MPDPLDFNNFNAYRQDWCNRYRHEQLEAINDLKLEEFVSEWMHLLGQFFERDEYYDSMKYKDFFIKQCSEEFDRQCQWGPSCQLKPGRDGR